MPAVSVVIPSYRGGGYLRAAIASVQAQTLENWELVVVLDGCTDDLSDIEAADSRVRVVRQANRGECVSRNVGIMHARADLVALLDDDDRMLPTRLESQVAEFSDGQVGLCHTQFRVIDANGTTVGSGTSGDVQYHELLRGDAIIVITTTMIRRDLLQELGGFNSLYRMAGDVDLIYRVARECKVVFLPEVLTEYRRHGGHVSAGVSGGSLAKLSLRQHLLLARTQGDVDTVRAIRSGMARRPTGRAELAIIRARESRTNGRYVGMFRELLLALLLSPRITTNLALRQAKVDLSGVVRRRPRKQTDST
jgi:glycosyltransferase involved in cell wall biosynthesis